MFQISELKRDARKAIKANFLICILAALILGILSGSGSNGRDNQGESYEDGGVIIDMPVDLNSFVDQAVPEDSFTAKINFFLSNNINRFSLSNMITSVMIMLGIGTFFFSILYLFLVVNVIEVGGCRFFLENAGTRAPLKSLLYGYTCGEFGNIVFVMLLRFFKNMLWYLLLVIPGICKSYEYRMIPYLLAEDPSLSSEEAFRQSRAMMDGNKMHTFLLDLSFLGWFILAVFTFGLSEVLWSDPYQHQTNANLYLTLKNQNL